MATDNSPPRIKLILVLAISTVVTLFVLKFIFDSYFTEMMEHEAKAKTVEPIEVRTIRAEEDKKLTGSPVPIDKAISDLASKGREASPIIAPQPSDDTAAQVGWLQGSRALAAKAAEGEGAKKEAAPAPSSSAAAAPAPGSTTTTTAATTDAGTHVAATPKDGGH